MNELAVLAYAASATVHALCAAYLVASGRLRQDGSHASLILFGALGATALWAGFAAAAIDYKPLLWPSGAALFDLARYALWFAFLLAITRGAGLDDTGPVRLLKRALGVILGVAFLWQVLRVLGGVIELAPSRAVMLSLFALPLGGMLLVEQLFRNLAPDSRWNVKPLCLGLACVFGFDLYLYSTALLFGAVDTDADAMRGAAHLVGLPFLFVAVRRSAGWTVRMRVSRKVAFHSATLLLAGAYLLILSSAGYYVRYFGGDWGRALQLTVVFAAVVFGLALVLSGSLRAKLNVFLGKHFFSYRFDYRDQWLRFTSMLSVRGSPSEVGQQVIRGLADMVESPAGSLWLLGERGAGYAQAARWNVPASDAREPASSAFCDYLRSKAWVVDLEEYRRSPRHYPGLALPTWLLETPASWLAVPLLVGDDLLGFVLLASPRTRFDVDWEVLDLMKTASRQAASYLAQIQATEALLEARKFDAFNRMSAFVVHDLKNIVTQLSLMLKNAERLHDNPEFQQDMLLTVQSSLEKMRRLMLQLREGAAPPGGSNGVEVTPIVAKLVALAAGQGRTLEQAHCEPLATRGHDERLERVLGHLVQNAIDATPPEGRIWIGVERHGGQVRIEIGDTGAGMTEEFVQTRIFKPFSSTKTSGMGVGLYESGQYVRELGGSISVASAPGQGTVFTVLLPLFERQSGSDLLSPAS